MAKIFNRALEIIKPTSADVEFLVDQLAGEYAGNGAMTPYNPVLKSFLDSHNVRKFETLEFLKMIVEVAEGEGES